MTIKPNLTFVGPRMEHVTTMLVPVLLAHEVPMCEYAAEPISADAAPPGSGTPSQSHPRMIPASDATVVTFGVLEDLAEKVVDPSVPGSLVFRCPQCKGTIEKIQVGPGENPQWRCQCCHGPESPRQSVGDKLGKIMLKESNSEPWEQVGEGVRRVYRRQAIAVRREVLAEPFTDEDLYSACAAYRGANVGNPATVSAMRAALSAALASRLEREKKQKSPLIR